ncbi:Uncharacterised protein [Candidatus Burarchaeum australiense]|nr:Uncharacterised protein [Candidatus Burarchaeum australiense]
MRFFGIAAVLIVVGLLFLGCAQQGPAQPAPGGATTPNVSSNQTANKTPIELIIEADQQRAAKLSNRPDYLPAVVYKNLPPFPTDFYETMVLVQYGKMDMQDFGPEYWKQPEWYPNFEGAGVQMMQNPPMDRWGAWGLGAYPSDMLVVTDQGTNFTATTYIYSSWLVKTYQGVGLETAYPAETTVPYEETGFKVIQNSSEASKYFDVTFDPPYLLLGPAFPIFDANWTQKVLVHVNVKPDAKPGNYVIGVNAGGPPSDVEKEWFAKYRTNYVTSSFASGVDRPYFQITVVVKVKGAA